MQALRLRLPGRASTQPMTELHAMRVCASGMLWRLLCDGYRDSRPGAARKCSSNSAPSRESRQKAPRQGIRYSRTCELAAVAATGTRTRRMSSSRAACAGMAAKPGASGPVSRSATCSTAPVTLPATPGCPTRAELQARGGASPPRRRPPGTARLRRLVGLFHLVYRQAYPVGQRRRGLQVVVHGGHLIPSLSLSSGGDVEAREHMGGPAAHADLDQRAGPRDVGGRGGERIRLAGRPGRGSPRSD